MDTKILPLLRCPLTKQNLSLKTVIEKKIPLEDGRVITDIEEGFLISEDHEIAYPILKGIPRLYDGALYLNRNKFSPQGRSFLENYNIIPPSKEFNDNYLSTLKRFQKEWKEHSIEDKTWGLNQDQRFQKYCEYLDLDPDEFYANKLFLDIGAGTGQLPTTIAKRFSGEVFAIDLTNAIEKGELLKQKEKKSYFDRCHFIQADLSRLPLVEESFDFIHASGVLHHTPDTYQSFGRIIPFVKKDGKVGIWLYRRNNTKLPIVPFVKGEILGISNESIRKFTTRLNPDLLYNLIFMYVTIFHFAYKINELIRGKPHDQKIKERVTSLFDAFAPKFVNRHDPEEVIRWYEKMGFENIRESDLENTEGFNILGIRRQ